MTMDKALLCLGIWTSVTFITSFGELHNGSINWKLRLYRDLMANYDKNVKPESYPHAQLTVGVIFGLSRIESLDEKTQVLSTFGWIWLQWKDAVMQWNTSDYNGVHRIILEGKNVWIPEITLLNSVREGADLALETNYRCPTFTSFNLINVYFVPGQTTYHLDPLLCMLYFRYGDYDPCMTCLLPGRFLSRGFSLYMYFHITIYVRMTNRVRVHHTGSVIWSPGIVWLTSCKINLRHFPFDSQICEVQFKDNMYGAAEVNLTIVWPQVDLSHYVSNGEWDLVSTKVGRRESKPKKDGETSHITVIVAFQLHLSRKPAYFVLHLLLPTILMNIVLLLVFFLPPEAGEKISLSITVLLSYTVLFLMMSDITPRSSETIPILSIYIILSMGLSALSLLSTVLVLRIHHHRKDEPVSPKVRHLVLDKLRRYLCIRYENGGCEGNEFNKRNWEAVACVIDRFFFVVYSLVVGIATVAVLVEITTHNDVRADPDNIVQ